MTSGTPERSRSHEDAAARRTRPPATWGRLQVRDLIGKGAFAEVYRAFDTRFRNEVALKLIRPGTSMERHSERVACERRNLARVRHPNVVTALGMHTRHGRTGFWMELIQGATLEQLLRWRGPFGADEAALVGRQLCSAVEAVHAAGLVHGDIKAQNVMRDGRSGRIVLIDFGSSLGPEDCRTGPGDLTGTLVCLAPEVLNGAQPTASADIYGIGVLLFHLVIGGYPVQGSSAEELREAHSNGRIRRLSDIRPDLPHAFVEAVEGAIREADSRYDTAAAMRLALSRVREPDPLAPGTWKGLRACVSAVTINPSLALADTATPSFAEQTRTACFDD